MERSKRISRDIAQGARWARGMTLLYGIGGCVMVLLAIWSPWTARTPIVMVFGMVAALCAMSYLRRTRR